VAGWIGVFTMPQEMAVCSIILCIYLEGFLVGNQDLERLEALLEHFNIFEATGWYWGRPRG